jgi:nitroreductase
MKKGSAHRESAHPINPLFLDRWSPRSLSGEPITDGELMTLFEAARWAPSSGNFQPWRFLYARRDSDFWPAFFDLLKPGNQAWAARAAVLVLVISRTHFEGVDGRPCVTHSYDSGASWENLALQASLMGLVAHGMEGFDYERARRVLRVPAGYAVEAMAAIGRPAAGDAPPDPRRKPDHPSSRRPLEQTICEGPFNL